jgi:hypothetical protein
MKALNLPASLLMVAFFGERGAKAGEENLGKRIWVVGQWGREFGLWTFLLLFGHRKCITE